MLAVMRRMKQLVIEGQAFSESFQLVKLVDALVRSMSVGG